MIFKKAHHFIPFDALRDSFWEVAPNIDIFLLKLQEVSDTLKVSIR